MYEKDGESQSVEMTWRVETGKVKKGGRRVGIEASWAGKGGRGYWKVQRVRGILESGENASEKKKKHKGIT